MSIRIVTDPKRREAFENAVREIGDVCLNYTAPQIANALEQHLAWLMYLVLKQKGEDAAMEFRNGILDAIDFKFNEFSSDDSFMSMNNLKYLS